MSFTIEFDPKELEIVVAALERRVTDLQFELCHTDQREFKSELRKQEESLESVLSKLQSARDCASALTA